MNDIKLYYLNKRILNEESELKILQDNKEYWSYELTQSPKNREIYNKILYILEEISEKEKLLYDLYTKKCMLEKK